MESSWVLIALALAASSPAQPAPGEAAGRLAMLGRHIFFDASLSEPPGQSCATCHSPGTGFTGESSRTNATTAVYEGARKGTFGNRKPPSAAYATPSPPLRYDAGEDLFVGGLFFDGRATGWRLHSTAAEQALGPFLNPVEQNLPDAAEVVKRICAAPYGHLFRRQFGEDRCSPQNAAAAFDDVGRAVAEFEGSRFVNAYGSKFDRYLRHEAKLTAREARGLALFVGKAKCAECHSTKPGPAGEPPIFTDNTFDNLGLPRNPRNPVYATPGNAGWVDPGLGGFLATLANDAEPARAALAAKAGANRGKHRVPTLRNVDKRPSPKFVKSYGHNGVFTSLKEIIHFYNTRDVLPRCDAVKGSRMGVNCWPAPEVAENVNRDELGNLGLSGSEEDDLVAFLKTLSDA